jgi:ubiquinone/menaquinone biosynthesis C-methylase UbiE
MKPPKMEPTKLGVVGKIRWKTVRLFMLTIGKTSQGVSTGFRYGFNSGTMLDYVYRNEPQGSWGIGKYLDKTYLNAIGWRAIRNRRQLLQSMLRVELERYRSQNQEIRLLDVAAGPGRYLQELLKENPANFRVLCRDLMPEGLNQGKLEAQEAGLSGIHFEAGDAFNPAPTNDSLGGQPNIMVVSGLYEQITDDKTVSKSLRTFFELLAPGGIILLTTQLQHPQLDFVANVMTSYSGEPWQLMCRYLQTIEEWVGQAGFEEITSNQEKEGLCAVTRARKPLL